MLTHVLWFIALVACCFAVAVAERVKTKEALRIARADSAEATALWRHAKEDAVIARIERKMANDARDHWRTETKAWEKRYEKEKDEYARFVDNVIHRIRGGATLGTSDDEPIEDPPTVAQADRMAFEESRNREQLRLGDDHAAPLIRTDASEEEEDDGN